MWCWVGTFYSFVFIFEPVILKWVASQWPNTAAELAPLITAGQREANEKDKAREREALVDDSRSDVSIF